jgi:ABC-type sugar transport system permease subunit
MPRGGPAGRAGAAPPRGQAWEAGLWWFLAPAALAVFVVIVLPVGYAIWLSLYDFNIMRMTDRFVGFGNYLKILNDANFGWAILRTFTYVFVVIAADFVYGFGTALLAWQLPLGWSRVFRAIVILPMLLIPSAAAMLWRSVIYTPPFGVFNQVFGLPMSFSMLASPDTSLFGIILTAVWGWSPWVFLLLLVGLEGLPAEPLEAARIDGATFRQIVCHIVLPMMRPVIVVTLSLKAIDSFLSFTYPWVMTQGGPGGSSHLLSTYIYERAFALLDYGYGASLGVVMMLIALASSTAFALYGARKGLLQ